MTTKYFQKIVRLKPIIESNQDIIERLKGCFDFSVNQELPKPREFISGGTNKSRFIFHNFPHIIDPFTGEKEFFILKLSADNLNLDYQLKRNLKLNAMLYAELGALEHYGQDGQEVPSFFGAVADHRYSLAGIIMEDASMGGRFRVEDGEDITVQTLKVYDEKILIKEVINDLKHCMIQRNAYREAGAKYIEPNAIIGLR